MTAPDRPSAADASTEDTGTDDATPEQPPEQPPEQAPEQAPEPEPGTTRSPRAGRTVPARTFRAVVALAVVAALVVVGVGVWTVATRSWEPFGVEVAGQQDDQQAERDELMSIGRQFMLRSGTYGPEGLDEEGRLVDYREQVTELITPSFANTFDTDAGIAEQLVAQSQVSRTAEVFSTGVADMESDAATVLVAGSITDAYPQLDQPQEPFPFRVEVQLVKVEGEWLVDDFAGVQRPEEEQAPIDPDLPVPSEEPSPGTGQGGQGGQGGGQGQQQGGGR